MNRVKAYLRKIDFNSPIPPYGFLFGTTLLLTGVFGGAYIGRKMYLKCDHHSNALLHHVKHPKNTRRNALMFSLLHNEDTMKIIKYSSMAPLLFGCIGLVVISTIGNPFGPIIGMLVGSVSAKAMFYSWSLTNDILNNYKQETTSRSPYSDFGDYGPYKTYLDELK